MTLAVHQPYLFPYLGYFQLVGAVDKFVFLDDVHYIKRGWINRNRILINGEAVYITVPCIKVSQNKLISETYFDKNHSGFQKLLKTVHQAYAKAPFFENIFPLIEKILNTDTELISELAAESVRQIAAYIGLKTQLLTASQSFPLTRGMEKTSRIIEICHLNGATQYINAINGRDLYTQEDFQKEGIQLNFIQMQPLSYPQFKNEFVPHLSIIDVLMFNSVEEVRAMVQKYELVVGSS